MSSTRWALAPWKGKQKYLLCDGSIAETPALETTPSHRRWRIAGDTSMSVTEGELHGVLRRAVDNQARTKNTTVWMRVLAQDDRRANLDAASQGWFMEAPTISAFSRKNTPQSVWFEFVHDKHPSISAVLFLTWSLSYNDQVTVTASMAYQNTMPDGDKFQEYAGQWNPSPDEYEYVVAERLLRTALDRDLHPTDGVGAFGTWTRLTYRQGMARFLESLRAFAGVNQVTLPDLRSVDLAQRKYDYGKLTLNLVDSNFDRRLYSELLDQVQGESVVERLKEHLDGVARELRNLGLVVKSTPTLAELTKAKPSELPVRLTVTPDHDVNVNGTPVSDPGHELHIDLLRATMTVACGREFNSDVLDAWEVARFKADLTGEEDVLLAYARAYNRPAERARAERVRRAKDVTVQPLGT